ncbi:YkvA family protein [Bacillus inaquosorum]|uniref:YkvA family protein n=1 Tax=Bacillus inaquosorum TaxID=483913 RepID=UPI0002FA8AE2|nr:YkvA family protein [Bacillus inaquosorum]MED4647059.1 YkvA family protein [Bacillus inaquosorum]MED4791731.1 YkvA family protein [Bacillus inaquosorum]
MKKKKAIMLGAAGGKAILKRKNRKKCIQHITIFFQMLRDWRNGDYPRSQVKTLLLLSAAILYIAMPLDIIPDVIFGLGIIDDAAVLGLIWTLIKKEMSQYEKWRLQ